MYEVDFDERDLIKSKFLADDDHARQYLFKNLDKLENWLDSNCKSYYYYYLDYRSGCLIKIYFKHINDLMLFRMTW